MNKDNRQLFLIDTALVTVAMGIIIADQVALSFDVSSRTLGMSSSALPLLCVIALGGLACSVYAGVRIKTRLQIVCWAVYTPLSLLCLVIALLLTTLNGMNPLG